MPSFRLYVRCPGPPEAGWGRALCIPSLSALCNAVWILSHCLVSTKPTLMKQTTDFTRLLQRKVQIREDSYFKIFFFFHIPFYFVQSLNRVQLFAAPWTEARLASLSFTISQSLLKLMSIQSVVPSNHLILCRTILFLPSIFPSIRAFSNKSALCIRYPKYWSFSFNIRPSNEYSGLISFRIDWLALLAVQETLKSPVPTPQFKTSILQRSAFCKVQLSHPYMTTAYPLPTYFSTGNLNFLISFIYVFPPHSPPLYLPPVCPLDL